MKKTFVSGLMVALFACLIGAGYADETEARTLSSVTGLTYSIYFLPLSEDYPSFSVDIAFEADNIMNVSVPPFSTTGVYVPMGNGLVGVFFSGTIICIFSAYATEEIEIARMSVSLMFGAGYVINFDGPGVSVGLLGYYLPPPLQ